MARRSLILLAAGALLVAGCFGAAAPPPPPDPPPPPPPPAATQACGLGFANASQYQNSYFTLGNTGTGWVTADGFVPVQVPDGRTLWWMSDTTTGTANPDRSVSGRGNVHNTIVQQSGGCLTPTFGNPEVIPNSGGAWYWPGSAVIQGNTMKVFSYKLVSASGPPGFDWTVVGTSVTSFALPSLQRIGGPTDMPSLSNQESNGNIPFGIRSFYKASEGMTYLYGSTGSLFTARTWLARAPSGQEANAGAWQFSADPPGTWSSTFADAKPIQFLQSDGVTSEGPPIAQLSVVPYGSRYLAGAFIWDAHGPDIGAWVADNPWGPWVHQPSNVATFQPRTNKQLGYDARIAQLPGAGWTVVYSANDPEGQFSDWTLYRGQFAAPNGLP
jgi:hypothetical protein